MSTSGPIANGTYKISNATYQSHNMAKLDVNAVAIFDSNSLWIITWDGQQGNYIFTHKGTGKVLDIVQSSHHTKSIIVHKGHDAHNQRWEIMGSDAGGYHINSVSFPDFVVAITSQEHKTIYNLYGVPEGDDGLKRWHFTEIKTKQ